MTFERHGIDRQTSRKKALASLVFLLFATLPAGAGAAPVFPGASGVGLEPPPGMTPATTFNGFRNGGASIVITELPKEAYAQIEAKREMFTSRLGTKTAEDVDVNGVHGFQVKGREAAGGKRFRKWVVVLDGQQETALVSVQVPQEDRSLTDAAIEAALKSIAFRDRPGLAEQVAALPFSVGDLAGFRTSGAAMGAALILTDGPKDRDMNQSQAHVVIATNPGRPPADDRVAFAKAQLTAFQAVRTTQVESADLFDAGGTQWAQVKAKGSEGQNETPVAITYFIRFGSESYQSIVCVAPADEAAKYADRFKTLALSVKPKA